MLVKMADMKKITIFAYKITSEKSPKRVILQLIKKFQQIFNNPAFVYVIWITLPHTLTANHIFHCNCKDADELTRKEF